MRSNRDRDNNNNNNNNNQPASNNFMMGVFALGALGLTVGAGMLVANAIRSNGDDDDHDNEEEHHAKPASSSRQANKSRYETQSNSTDFILHHSSGAPRKAHTHSRPDSSVHDLTTGISRVSLKDDDKPAPPNKDAIGYWVTRDKFRGRKSYGHFRCKRKHTWLSAHSYPDDWQACKRCESKVCPTYLWVNSDNNSSRVKRNEGGKPHDMERCGRCRSLGGPCWIQSNEYEVFF